MTCCLPKCRKPGEVPLWADDPAPPNGDGRRVLWFCLRCADFYEAKGYRRVEEQAA